MATMQYGHRDTREQVRQSWLPCSTDIGEQVRRSLLLCSMDMGEQVRQSWPALVMRVPVVIMITSVGHGETGDTIMITCALHGVGGYGVSGLPSMVTGEDLREKRL